MGLVMLKSQASGQCSSMALPMPTRTGMLRRARLMPPGPTVSPTVWVMPCAAGTSRSTAMERKPPVEMHTMTKSAPSRAVREVGGGGDGRLGLHGVVELVGQRLHLGQRSRVDVLEHEVHAGQRRRAEEVGHQLRPPLVAAAADDRHLGPHGRHSTVPRRAQPPASCSPGARRGLHDQRHRAPRPPAGLRGDHAACHSRGAPHRTHLCQRAGRAGVRRRAGPAHPVGRRGQRGHAGGRLPGQRADGARRRDGPQPGPADSRAVAWGRLPLQLVMVWAALQSRTGPDPT